MGMAASQARLLTITARLADNELRSQTINNAKMRLATQSSQASENYINALNNATYKFTNYDETGGLVNQPLTFNALTTYSPYNTQYGLVNSAGQLLVSETEARLFAQSGNNLDKYLESHGLKYDTSYFDTINTPLKNDAYPAPFNSLDKDTLKTYFEEYDSYENSMEIDEYNRTYLQFVKSDKEIKKYGEDLMKEFLTSTELDRAPVVTADNPLVKNSTGYDLSTWGDNVTLFKTILTDALSNATNPYCLEELVKAGFISDNIKKQCEAIRDSINQNGNTMTITEEVEPNYDDTTKSYSFDGIVVEKDGDQYKVNHSALTNGDGETYNWQTPGDDERFLTPGVAIGNIQYSVTYGDENNGKTVNYKYNYNEQTKKITKTYTTNDTDIIKDAYSSVMDNIINTILSNADYSKFCEQILENPGAYGIDINGNSKITEIIENYKHYAYEYITNIFGEDAYESVMEDIKSGTIIKMLDEKGEQLYEDDEKTIPVEEKVTIDNLQDIEFVLQYMREKGYEPSKMFQTVIKDYLVDEMIDEYGTPKYAWIDENDTGNTGNADAKAQWYTNLFKRMQRGYKALENGLASSKDWIEYALESGTVYMEQVDASFVWNALDYKTCSRIIEETDDKAVARAEAEYNRAMNDIKAKDNIFDLELKNIDTEHNALQTEYDVIKGVISKNIERNFKFNQSA